MVEVLLVVFMVVAVAWCVVDLPGFTGGQFIEDMRKGFMAVFTAPARATYGSVRGKSKPSKPWSAESARDLGNEAAVAAVLDDYVNDRLKLDGEDLDPRGMAVALDEAVDKAMKQPEPPPRANGQGGVWDKAGGYWVRDPAGKLTPNQHKRLSALAAKRNKHLPPSKKQLHAAHVLWQREMKRRAMEANPAVRQQIADDFEGIHGGRDKPGAIMMLEPGETVLPSGSNLTADQINPGMLTPLHPDLVPLHTDKPDSVGYIRC
jgi:hypothetical protein